MTSIWGMLQARLDPRLELLDTDGRLWIWAQSREGLCTHQSGLSLECMASSQGLGQTRLVQILAQLLTPCVTLDKRSISLASAWVRVLVT